MGVSWTPRKCGVSYEMQVGFFSDVDHFLKLNWFQYCFYFTSWFSGQERGGIFTFPPGISFLHWKAKSSNVKGSLPRPEAQGTISWLPFLVGRVLTVPGVS